MKESEGSVWAEVPHDGKGRRSSRLGESRTRLLGRKDVEAGVKVFVGG